MHKYFIQMLKYVCETSYTRLVQEIAKMIVEIFKYSLAV